MTDYSEAVEQLETVIDYVRFVATQMEQADLYFGHGTDNAWDEAVALVFHVLSIAPELGKNVMLARLVTAERQQILALLTKRIKERTPLAYLTNHARYYELDFFVDERVLIPRSPIAELIEQRFAPWLAYENVNNILELCTGSGCISIAMAYEFEHAYITATDLSLDALAVASMNIEAHGLEERVSLIESDVYNSLPENKYELIVANPPYVCDDEMSELPNEYLQEPYLALQADDEGLAIVDRILSGAKEYLSEEGVLVVEVGNSEHALQEKYSHVPFQWLEFERGGSGVFLLTYQQLTEFF